MCRVTRATSFKIFKFKIQLKFPLFLPDLWKVALVKLHATKNTRVSKITADEGLYLYLDICKGSIAYGEKRALLRRLEKNARNEWDYILDNPFYLDVTKNEIRDFEIYIRLETNTDATHLMKPVHLTLHFKRYPFC